MANRSFDPLHAPSRVYPIVIEQYLRELLERRLLGLRAKHTPLASLADSALEQLHCISAIRRA